MVDAAVTVHAAAAVVDAAVTVHAAAAVVDAAVIVHAAAAVVEAAAHGGAGALFPVSSLSVSSSHPRQIFSLSYIHH